MSRRLVAVAVDFSPGARAAFQEALVHARRGGERLLLVHVIPPLITPSPLLDDMSAASLNLELRQGLDQSAKEQLSTEYAARAADLQPEIMIVDGDPARELVRICREREVSLLFMGSTGLTGLAETIFGSVAAKVVRKAPCSVMVVRGQEKSQE
jgi:nucleotide-binding universal stress UspA family protein